MASSHLQANHLHTRLESKSTPVFLRTITLDDAPFHAALLSDPANGADPNSKPMTEESSRGAITKQIASADVPTIYDEDLGRVLSGPSRVNMMVCLTEPDLPSSSGNGDIIIGLGGYGAIKDWERDGKKIRAGDVGVLLDPKYRGKGYAVEAMKLAIEWAFTPVSKGGPQLDLVTITTLEDNAAMVALTEQKLGQAGKGVLRPAEFDENKQEKYWEVNAQQWKGI